jgi:hypothetical protein
VIALSCIEADEVDNSASVPQILDYDIAAANGILERVSNFVQPTVGDTHSPHEILYIQDVFLVRFRGEDYRGTPSTGSVFLNPAHFQKFMNVLHNNGAFIHTI